MMRFIFFVVMVALAIGYVRHRWLRSTVSLSDTGEKTMLQCNHCQVYFPKSEAVMVAGVSYCCIAHAHLNNKE